MQFGKIPSKLLLVCRGPEILKSTWDDVADSIVADRTILPCIAADADSKDQVAQAVRWGTTSQPGKHEMSPPFRQEAVDNSPRTIFICGLDKRQEGGRAFKVVDEHNHLFDLREDVLLDSLHDCGVQKGGQVNGSFVFARIHSQMRLVRVGSKLHAELSKAEARRVANNLSAKELIVGGVYANRRGLFIYMGQVDTVEDLYVNSRRSYTVTSAGSALAKKLQSDFKTEDQPYIKRLHVTGEHLVIPVAKYEQSDPGNVRSNAMRNQLHSGMWVFSKAVSAVELVSKLQVPQEFLKQVKAVSLDYLKHHLERTQPDDRNSSEIEQIHASNLCTYSAGVNIRPHGEGAVTSSEYEQLSAKYGQSQNSAT